MDNKSLIKAGLIFGGGLLLFLGLKAIKPTKNKSKSFDSTKPESKPAYVPSEKDKEDAEIVATAYTSALANNEPSSKMTELNKELMKEFGMRCYVDKSGSLIVCDTSGNIIMKK